ncbi:MAG: ABC transporter substrate-binding protein [Cyanothece sp. SIO2G6]|nr:ABC transporter substrate-binding protein [Cyanothece sp. SIO2G6]
MDNPDKIEKKDSVDGTEYRIEKKDSVDEIEYGTEKKGSVDGIEYRVEERRRRIIVTPGLVLGSLLILVPLSILMVRISPEPPIGLPDLELPSDELNDSDVENRITFGEHSLIERESFDPLLETAIQAIAANEKDAAIEPLEDYLEQRPNDPEAQIFLNNLRSEKSNEVYNIAVSVPISSNPNASLEILRGVAQAQFELLSSRRASQAMLRIAIVDDDDKDPDNENIVAQEVASELAARDDILGVVGPYSSDTSLATIGIYEQSKLVVISPISTSVELTDHSDYFFRTVPSDRIAAEDLGLFRI